ncbi:uncharacterized protein DEA37_0003567 [Paragonimus westermani]|uniref:Uncharacterized protein n=1 Tax=Paragonimus westermani TaxID=34504 RepID=A0A5J4NDS9_9TREM|nr:uncharacterized protein DEA37_0003567 [Paragonimus westermani]
MQQKMKKQKMKKQKMKKLIQWMINVSVPAKPKLALHSLEDTFEFLELISNINVKHQVMTSFDVELPFKDVLLDEVTDSVYNYATEHNLTLGNPIDVLLMLLKVHKSDIEILFNDAFYRQIDGVVMGSLSGPMLADTVMGNGTKLVLNASEKRLKYLE